MDISTGPDTTSSVVAESSCCNAVNPEFLFTTNAALHASTDCMGHPGNAVYRLSQHEDLAWGRGDFPSLFMLFFGMLYIEWIHC